MRKYRSALLGVSLIVTTAPSQAALYDITYTGVVSSGYDETGKFLSAGSSFANNPFTAVFTLNYPVPVGAYEYKDSVTHQVGGGDVYGTPSILSAKITINGRTDSVSGNYIGLDYLYDGPGQDNVYHDAQDFSSSLPNDWSFVYSYVYTEFDNYLNGPDITQTVSYTADSNDHVGGGFQFREYDEVAGAYNKNAYGNLSPSSVTISVSAVPEQSTWAMMITAFGLTGAAFRRRRTGEVLEQRSGPAAIAESVAKAVTV